MTAIPTPLKGPSYYYHLDYCRQYLALYGPTDPLDLAVVLVHVFGLCGWEAEEVAIEAAHAAGETITSRQVV